MITPLSPPLSSPVRVSSVRLPLSLPSLAEWHLKQRSARTGRTFDSKNWRSASEGFPPREILARELSTQPARQNKRQKRTNDIATAYTTDSGSGSDRRDDYCSAGWVAGVRECDAAVRS